MILGFLVASVLSSRADLDAILLDPALKGAVVSVCVRDESGQILYEKNSDLRMVPASNLKLLTCAYALSTLGPEYRPCTRFWKESGRVIVESTGDPSMKSAALIDAAKKLRVDPRSEVWVKQAYRPLIPPSWEFDDLPNRYAAPISAFSADEGSFELWRSKGKLELRPKSYGVRLQLKRSEDPLTVEYSPLLKRLTARGKLPDSDQRLDTLAVAYPDEAAASWLGNRFKLVSKTPERAADLEVVGDSVAQMIGQCLTKSDNFYAENLLFMASGKTSYSEAVKSLQSFLTKAVELEETDLKLDDGSGLSRHNLVTTRALTQLLTWAKSQPTQQLWLDSLAQPGKGTLKDRLEGVEFWGKTGTLEGVTALSGYLKTQNAGNLTVSFLLNHYICRNSDAQKVCDNFLKALVLAQDLKGFNLTNERTKGEQYYDFVSKSISVKSDGVATGDRPSRSRGHRRAA